MFYMAGGSNKLNYTKCINSLEELLHAKVHIAGAHGKISRDWGKLLSDILLCKTFHSHVGQVCSVDNEELESVVASPDMEVYFYGPVNHSNLTTICIKELDSLKLQVKFCSTIMLKLSLLQLTKPYVFCFLFSLLIIFIGLNTERAHAKSEPMRFQGFSEETEVLMEVA